MSSAADRCPGPRTTRSLQGSPRPWQDRQRASRPRTSRPRPDRNASQRQERRMIGGFIGNPIGGVIDIPNGNVTMTVTAGAYAVTGQSTAFRAAATIAAGGFNNNGPNNTVGAAAARGAGGPSRPRPGPGVGKGLFGAGGGGRPPPAPRGG